MTTTTVAATTNEQEDVNAASENDEKGPLQSDERSNALGPYVIVSKWGYPYGGGEEFLLDSIKYAAKGLGMHTIWLCYTDARNEPYASFDVMDVNDARGGTRAAERRRGVMTLIVRVNGGFSERSVYCWLRLLRPAFVHHQGALKIEVETVCRLLRIPIMNGFHFWHGLIEMHPTYSNVRMIEHARDHKPDKHLQERMECEYDLVYVASQYMVDVAEAVCGKDVAERLWVLPPLSGVDKCHVDDDRLTGDDAPLWSGDDGKAHYITFINVHESKGGRLLLYLLQEMPDVPFLGVRTDTYRTPFDDELDRAFDAHTRARLIGRVEDVRRIYRRSRILIQASEVDETFCRVLVEACASGVPTLCSDYGNIPYLIVSDEAKRLMVVPSSETRAETYQAWKARLSGLLGNAQTVEQISRVARRNYTLLSERLMPQQTFCNAVHHMLQRVRAKPQHVALLTPWCDQGLGIQNRNYAYLLRRSGYEVFVFAFLPYTRTKHQAEPREWMLPGVTVYESRNVREEVTLGELVEFVVKYRIDAAIIAESCWDRVFSMAAELRSLGVRTYAVPNIEIVRRDEIEKHRVFHRILLNNNKCGDVMRAHGVEAERLHYVGYSIEPPIEGSFLHEQRQSAAAAGGDKARGLPGLRLDLPFFTSRSQRKQREIRFLILGGMNAVFRKYVDVVVTAFIEAQLQLFREPQPRDGVAMKLLATSQKSDDRLKPLVARIESNGMLAASDGAFDTNLFSRGNGENPYDTVKLLVWHLSADTVEHLYQWCDVVIQVSKHEGLGIGFFEAQERYKPVLTINVPPHNEIVTEEYGWILEPDDLIENDENDSGCLPAARVSVDTVKAFFLRVGRLPAKSWAREYNKKHQAIKRMVPKRREAFRDAFCAALDDETECRLRAHTVGT